MLFSKIKVVVVINFDFHPDIAKGPEECTRPQAEWNITIPRVVISQARRQGGFEGIRSNPPFGFQKILYAPLNCTF